MKGAIKGGGRPGSKGGGGGRGQTVTTETHDWSWAVAELGAGRGVVRVTVRNSPTWGRRTTQRTLNPDDEDLPIVPADIASTKWRAKVEK